MKRIDLVKKIEAGGCVMVRHGGRHDWYRNPITGVSLSRFLVIVRSKSPSRVESSECSRMIRPRHSLTKEILDTPKNAIHQTLDVAGP